MWVFCGCYFKDLCFPLISEMFKILLMTYQLILLNNMDCTDPNCFNPSRNPIGVFFDNPITKFVIFLSVIYLIISLFKQEQTYKKILKEDNKSSNQKVNYEKYELESMLIDYFERKTSKEILGRPFNRNELNQRIKLAIEQANKDLGINKYEYNDDLINYGYKDLNWNYEHNMTEEFIDYFNSFISIHNLTDVVGEAVQKKNKRVLLEYQMIDVDGEIT